MDSVTIKQYNSQYFPQGGVWNRQTCERDGKIETYSGPGSLLENTDNLVEELSKFIKEKNITSMIDAPCGDFNFMSKVDLSSVEYHGYDVSENAVKMCKSKRSDLDFQVKDISKDRLPYADLIFIKDLFLHLSFFSIQSILDNVVNSGCKYFAVSRYSNGREVNKDQNSGLGCRAIEVTTSPFNFSYPIIHKFYYSKNHKEKHLYNEMIIFQLN
jgi:hypothetical protein